VLQQADVAMALVHDEYGHLEGVVTPADLLSAIAGNFVSHLDDGDEPMVVEREDGSLLVAGALPAGRDGERLGIDLPDDRDYATAAGSCSPCSSACRARASTSGAGLAVRGRRHGRPQDRQVARRPAQARPREDGDD
jgi:hypothetical protein